MNLAPLIETTRSRMGQAGTVENVHYGAIAVVDAAGKLRYRAGDADYLTFTRSALKPFQALPFVLDDGLARMGFEAADLALMCASHSGEPEHVVRIASMLERANLHDSDLGCGCHVPLVYATTHQKAPDQVFGPIYNNCSGKHTGMLAWCRLHGVSHANYLDFDHPVQVRIRNTVGELASSNQLPAGTDGCSAPNYAMPLSRLAQLYARLAQGSDDAAFGAPFGLLFNAMTRHPYLVSGTARTDLAYMTLGAGDWVSKAGADGVQTLGSKRLGLGIAVKIGDGAPRALHTAFVSVLEQLGLLKGLDTTVLKPWAAPVIRNHAGAEVGRIRSVFTLEKL